VGGKVWARSAVQLALLKMRHYDGLSPKKWVQWYRELPTSFGVQSLAQHAVHKAHVQHQRGCNMQEDVQLSTKADVEPQGQP
jgi:hypothetical protein